MNEAAATSDGNGTPNDLAGEIARARAEAPAIGHAEDEPCANCGAVRHGPYCHRCGQSGHVHRHAGALVHDIAHGVFHFEGRIWRTLPLLVVRPGELTRRYVAGERANFVSPVVLFLFSVFLMFAVLNNLPAEGEVAMRPSDIAAQRIAVETRLADLERERAAARGPAERQRLDGDITAGRIEARLLRATESRAAGRTVGAADRLDLKLGLPWFDEAFRHAAENPELLFYKMKTYAYKYSWALIPISLPFIWLLFAFRRDVGLYDHAIFSIYSLSFMSLGALVLALLGVVGVPGALLVLAVVIVPPLHMYRQLKGAYRLTRFAAGWRTAALTVITVVTMALFLAFLFYLGVE